MPDPPRVAPGSVSLCSANPINAMHFACRMTSQAELVPGQIVALLRVAAEGTVDAAVRQVAAIAFKNLVRRSWENEDDSKCHRSPPLLLSPCPHLCPYPLMRHVSNPPHLTSAYHPFKTCKRSHASV